MEDIFLQRRVGLNGEGVQIGKKVQLACNDPFKGYSHRIHKRQFARRKESYEEIEN